MRPRMMDTPDAPAFGRPRTPESKHRERKRSYTRKAVRRHIEGTCLQAIMEALMSSAGSISVRNEDVEAFRRDGVVMLEGV